MHRIPSFLAGASAPNLKVKLLYAVKRPLALERASLMSNSDSAANESHLPGSPSARTDPARGLALLMATPARGINQLCDTRSATAPSIGLDRKRVDRREMLPAIPTASRTQGDTTRVTPTARSANTRSLPTTCNQKTPSQGEFPLRKPSMRPRALRPTPCANKKLLILIPGY